MRIGLAIVLCGWALAVAAAQPVWVPVAEAVIGQLDRAVALYREARPDEARRAVIEAYFGVFETRKMEAAMRQQLGGKHTYLVERRFGDVRKAIKSGEAADVVAGKAQELAAALRADARKLDEIGVPAQVFEVNR